MKVEVFEMQFSRPNKCHCHGPTSFAVREAREVVWYEIKVTCGEILSKFVKWIGMLLGLMYMPLLMNYQVK